MNEDNDSSDEGREVVYLTEYGAAVPAWVTFDAARWWRVHPVFPSVLVVLTGVFVFLMLTVISGFLWLVLICVWLLWRHWSRLRHTFRHGNANPGRVVSVNPPLVAVWTDLDNSGEESEGPVYPAVKVLRYPLKSVLGDPLEVGQAVPTASIYAGDEKAAHWADFDPAFLEVGCGDREALWGVLGRVPEGNWAWLDEAVERLTAAGRLKPGLHRMWLG